jgi:flagellar biosynthesis protein FlhB
MADSDQERTEEATQQRREDFRKRGQVAQTRELASVFVLLTTALMMWGLSRFFLQQVSEMFTQSVGSFLVEAARSGDMMPASIYVLKRAFMIMAPLIGILTLMGIASTVVQVGMLNNEEALELKFDRLNPVEGFKRLFSLRSAIEGFKSVLKIICIAVVVWFVVRGQLTKLPLLSAFSIEQIIVYSGELPLKILMTVGIFMAVLAAADYFFQRWELEKQMRMTKQEIKEEHKSREGDPMIKARIRRIQRELANKRMMTDVPKADVIITNPTHIAIAIQYDPIKMAAPRVVAKGAGAVAERIKAIARENNIPIMENKPLARTIFKTLKIGATIPRELFTAVAQVLSYVYKLKRKKVN